MLRTIKEPTAAAVCYRWGYLEENDRNGYYDAFGQLTDHAFDLFHNEYGLVKNCTNFEKYDEANKNQRPTVSILT